MSLPFIKELLADVGEISLLEEPQDIFLRDLENKDLLEYSDDEAQNFQNDIDAVNEQVDSSPTEAGDIQSNLFRKGIEGVFRVEAKNPLAVSKMVETKILQLDTISQDDAQETSAPPASIVSISAAPMAPITATAAIVPAAAVVVPVPAAAVVVPAAAVVPVFMNTFGTVAMPTNKPGPQKISLEEVIVGIDIDDDILQDIATLFDDPNSLPTDNPIVEPVSTGAIPTIKMGDLPPPPATLPPPPVSTGPLSTIKTADLPPPPGFAGISTNKDVKEDVKDVGDDIDWLIENRNNPENNASLIDDPVISPSPTSADLPPPPPPPPLPPSAKVFEKPIFTITGDDFTAQLAKIRENATKKAAGMENIEPTIKLPEKTDLEKQLEEVANRMGERKPEPVENLPDDNDDSAWIEEIFNGKEYEVPNVTKPSAVITETEVEKTDKKNQGDWIEEIFNGEDVTKPSAVIETETEGANQGFFQNAFKSLADRLAKLKQAYIPSADENAADDFGTDTQTAEVTDTTPAILIHTEEPPPFAGF